MLSPKLLIDLIAAGFKNRLSAAPRLLGRASAGEGSIEELELSSILDAALPGATDGDILVRQGGIWDRLGLGTAGQVLTVSGGLPSWASPADLIAPTGSGRGVAARTNAANPLTQIDITADELVVRDEATGAAYRLTDVSVTADITASGANGLDTGAEANDTWYYGWVIYNPDTDTKAALLSESADAPTLPAGYTCSAFVTAVRNAGADFRPYRQYGAEVFYVDRVTAFSGTPPVAETAVSVATIVPSAAVSFSLQVALQVSSGGSAATLTVTIGYIAGSSAYVSTVLNNAATNTAGQAGGVVALPNIDQQYYHTRTTGVNGTAYTSTESIDSFKLPLGN